MHEMSLAEGIIQIIERQQLAKGSKVKEVILTLGELAAIEIPALEFGFEVVARGTAAEGATLVYQLVPGSAFCFPCGAQVPIKQKGDACPRCQGHQLTVIDGNQMQVKSLELTE
ncbi:hydrogenase maturation nickel metallochaperone HypA [Ferrimonas senticii]|uniref:hydrogenase maturation nickel metallochaperone HypA n=1 Tax=Ferrimonas senticii TaxID=394566 RepID=UPI000414BD1B|nr:hydrogenase maturation nickel metallochaperone HypA [Ferrimonas senticii]